MQADYKSPDPPRFRRSGAGIQEMLRELHEGRNRLPELLEYLEYLWIFFEDRSQDPQSGIFQERLSHLCDFFLSSSPEILNFLSERSFAVVLIDALTVSQNISQSTRIMESCATFLARSPGSVTMEIMARVFEFQEQITPDRLVDATEKLLLHVLHIIYIGSHPEFCDAFDNRFFESLRGLMGRMPEVDTTILSIAAIITKRFRETSKAETILDFICELLEWVPSWLMGGSMSCELALILKRLVKFYDLSNLEIPFAFFNRIRTIRNHETQTRLLGVVRHWPPSGWRGLIDDQVRAMACSALMSKSDKRIIAALKLIRCILLKEPFFAGRLFLEDRTNGVYDQILELVKNGAFLVRKMAIGVFALIVDQLKSIWNKDLMKVDGSCPELVLAIGVILEVDEKDDSFLGLNALRNVVEWWMQDFDPAVLMRYLEEAKILDSLWGLALNGDKDVRDMAGELCSVLREASQDVYT
jgi:hypothetical protein